MKGPVHSWQRAGDGELWRHLWSLVLLHAAAVLCFSVLATLREGFTSDETNLLMLLPVTPATLVRAMFVAVLLTAAGVESVVFVGVVALLLGRDALTWVTVGVSASLAAALAGMIATLLVARGSWKTVRTTIGMAAACIASVLTVVWLSWGIIGSSVPVPTAVAAVLLTLTILGIGPGARHLGDLYVGAYQNLNGRSTEARVGRPPVVARPFVTRLSRRRDVLGAMVLKELLYQGRNPWNLLRLAVLVCSVWAFPIARSRLDSVAISDGLLVLAFSCGIGLYALVDFIPSPIGSEGNRLTLYLTAPVAMADLLLAKLLVFLTPSLMVSTVLATFLGWWVRLSAGQLLLGLVSAWLIQIAATAALVWVSAWDEDLDVPVEGIAQTMLHEHIPMTVRRMGLVIISIAVLAAGVMTCWRLPTPLVMPSLAVMDMAVLIGAWRIGMSGMRRLTDAR